MTAIAEPAPARGDPARRSPSRSRPSTHRGSIAYVPALDGLRAVAVGAVVAFHFGIRGTRGGFLGVDVFFVLSGYLITALLTAEWKGGGTISLGSFWGRRARRLFPALAVTLVGVSVAAAALDTADQLRMLRSDAVSTAFYFANWHFVASSQHYFAHFGLPSPLLHTWSLAVEEQFYVVWPLVTLAVVALVRRRLPGSDLNRNALVSRRILMALCSAGVVASAVEMAVGFRPGSDPSRLYYGTDTHAQVILVGALLSLVRPDLPASPTQQGRKWMNLSGLAGLAILFWSFHFLAGDSIVLYRGGFVLVAAGAAMVIVHVTGLPDSLVSRSLSWGPVRYVGRISYGLYLYHWPVFVYLDPARTGLTGPELLVARIAATVVAAAASFHFVETPIREGFRGRLSGRAQAVGVLPAGAACVAIAVLASTAVPAGAGVPPATSVPTILPVGSHPAKVLLVGDSVAMTLGIGLSNPQSLYGVTVDDQGQLGCGIAEGDPIRVQGNLDTQVPCNPQTGQSWREFWTEQIARVHPDVVAVELGRWEVVDRQVDGRWTHIGQPTFDAYLTRQLDSAVSLLSTSGSQVALFTAPYYDEPASPDGSPWPENQPARVDRWNAIVRSVAHRHRGVATVVDVGGLLDPAGRFTQTVDGLAVRCPDGVHVSWQGGELLAPYVLPELERLSVLAAERAGAHAEVSPVTAVSEPAPPDSSARLRSLVSDKSPSPTCPFG